MFPIREAAFAGRFYPADREKCARKIEEMLAGLRADNVVPRETAIGGDERVSRETAVLGGLVPHAGWSYSGPTALRSIQAVEAERPDVVVVFGGVHVRDRNVASLYPSGTWDTPIGALAVDEALAARIARIRHVVSDAAIHAHEHSVEVELPLVRAVLGEVKILPLMVQAGEFAAQIGMDVAKAAADLGRRAVFLASTDLTHYGPAFGYEPAGRGPAGVRWAKEVNDRRFIGRVDSLDADAVVPEAVIHHNACGAGAVAATIAAVRELGARRYVELEHTCSAEVERAAERAALNSVGYQSGVFYV